MFDINKIINRKACKLYTLNGVFDASAVDCGNNKTHVQAINSNWNIIVLTTLANHKFEQEAKPTFYAC